MSRVGRVPIQIKGNLKIQINNSQISIADNLGNSFIKTLPKGVDCMINDESSKVSLTIASNAEKTKQLSALYGTERSILKSSIDGLISGHEIILELIGVGYKALAGDGFLTLTLGKSHDIYYHIPSSINIYVEKGNILTLKSADKKLVGYVASEISRFRPHEPYKGKGIKIRGQDYVRKEGKKK